MALLFLAATLLAMAGGPSVSAAPPPSSALDTTMTMHVLGTRLVVPEGLGWAPRRLTFSDRPVEEQPGSHAELVALPASTDSLGASSREFADRIANRDVYRDVAFTDHGSVEHGTQTFRTFTLVYYADEATAHMRPDEARHVKFAETRLGDRVWAFRWIHRGASMPAAEEKRWTRLLASVEPIEPSDPPFLGTRTGDDGTRRLHTPDFRMHLPDVWRDVSTYFFAPTGTDQESSEQESTKTGLPSDHIMLEMEEGPGRSMPLTMEQIQANYEGIGADLFAQFLKKDVDGRPSMWALEKTDVGDEVTRIHTVFIDTYRSNLYLRRILFNLVEIKVYHVPDEQDWGQVNLPPGALSTSRAFAQMVESIEFDDAYVPDFNQ